MGLFSLRRITSSAQYNPAIDGVRFLAIMLVLSQHLFERVSRRSVDVYGDYTQLSSSRFFSTGSTGVSIFFALSGYVLFSGLLRGLAKEGCLSGTAVRRYFGRRLSRIEPPYLVALTIVFLFLTLTRYQPKFAASTGDLSSLTPSYLASLVYFHNVFFNTYPRILPVAWSLEIEVQFYAIAPLIALILFRIRNFMSFFSLILLCSFVVFWCAIPVQRPPLTLVPVFPSFLGGILLAEAEAVLPHKLPRASSADIIGVVGGGLLLSRAFGSLPFGPWDPIIDATGTLSLLIGLLRGRTLLALASLNPVATIGGMCYSIYLVHLPIVEFTATLTRRFALGSPLPVYLVLQFALLTGALMAGAILFYIFVERPCMNPEWPQRLFRRFKRGRPQKN